MQFHHLRTRIFYQGCQLATFTQYQYYLGTKEHYYLYMDDKVLSLHLS